MPLLRFLSAMARRLWFALVLLFASFFLRSCTVSRFCPWPFTFPTTAELSCLYLGYTEKDITSSTLHLGGQKSTYPRKQGGCEEELRHLALNLGSAQLCRASVKAKISISHTRTTAFNTSSLTPKTSY